MSPARDPVPRARSPWNWLGGILLLGVLGGALIAAAVALWEQIDVGRIIPQLTAAPEPLPAAAVPPPAAMLGESFPVVLLRSSRNGGFFPDSSYYGRELRLWRTWAEEAGGRVREVSDIARSGSLTVEDVLVLAEAPCLSAEERRAVRSHLRRGGGVVSNWAVGARDAACTWLGWDGVTELAGAEDVREIPSREALFLTVPAGLALSPGLDPGTRIELRPDPSLAVRHSGPRIYWSDWALNPFPDESGAGADAASALHRPRDGGRSAWFGFRAGQAVTRRDSLLLARLVQNGLRWAGGRITAAPAPWPHAHRAAGLVTMDVEDRASNADGVADLLDEVHVPGTFFAVSRTTVDDAALGLRLEAAGEVGSHTSDHAPLAGLPRSEQAIRIRQAVREIQRWTAGEVDGLRPPEERFDRSTLDALDESGLRYLVGLNDGRSASPEVHTVPTGTVIVIPRLLKDDYNVFVQDRALRADRLGRAFLDGAAKLRALGGVAVFNLHSQIVDTPGRLAALREVVDTLGSQGDWWLASGSEVADWWRSRHRLEIAPASGSPPAFRVAAPAEGGIGGLWLDVVLPDGSAGWTAFVDEREATVDITEWGLRVEVGRLGPGEARLVRLERRLFDEGAS